MLLLTAITSQGSREVFTAASVRGISMIRTNCTRDNVPGISFRFIERLKGAALVQHKLITRVKLYSGEIFFHSTGTEFINKKKVCILECSNSTRPCRSRMHFLHQISRVPRISSVESNQRTDKYRAVEGFLFFFFPQSRIEARNAPPRREITVSRSFGSSLLNNTRK